MFVFQIIPHSNQQHFNICGSHFQASRQGRDADPLNSINQILVSPSSKGLEMPSSWPGVASYTLSE